MADYSSNSERGATSKFLTSATAAAADQSVQWKYNAQFRLNDEAVGRWSDMVSMAVNG